MPHSFNPKTGLIVNWNNKPAACWPNMDTPVWGRAFRNDSLIHALGTQPVTVSHLVGAAKAISEADSATSGSYRELFLRAMGDAPEFAVARQRINAYDGSQRNGDVNSAFYLEVVNELRRRLYSPSVGTLLNPSFFQQAVQPTTILRQLQGAGSLELVPSRRRDRVVREAILAMQAKADTLAPAAQGAIRYPGEEPIPYINRGTYIQIIRFGAQGIQAQTVLGPGNAESGEHSRDQAPLVRNWQFKPSALNTP
jgi:penicillin amidase